MRGWASILALIPGLAFGQLNLTTADNWQSIVQTAAPSSWFAFAAGTYTTTGTSLNVTSGWTRIQGAGPGQSILTSGHSTNWGVVVVSATNVQIDGFTITGGNTTNNGGGVQGHGLTVVSNCHVVSNFVMMFASETDCGGGGAHGVSAHDCVFANNVVTNPSANAGHGGALIFTHDSAVADRCLFSNNYAKVYGGAVSASHAEKKGWVLNSTAINNRVTFDGGGLAHCFASNVLAVGNWAGRRGGGFGGYAGMGFVTDSRAVSNTATKEGGGASSVKAARNSTFAHNTAGTTGGGGYDLYGTNLVVRDNVAGLTGGGMQYGLAESSTIERNVANGNQGGGARLATLLYSLIVSNRAMGATTGSGGGISGCTVDSCVFVDNYAAVSGMDSQNSTVRNCTIINTNAAVPVVQYDRAPSAVIANTLVVHASQTNIADLTGAAWTNVACNYFTNTVTNGLFLPDDPPYRLPPGSPLIDAGNDTYATTPLDLYGRTRTQGQVDIGAVEYTPEIDVVSGAVGRKKLLMLLLR